MSILHGIRGSGFLGWGLVACLGLGGQLGCGGGGDDGTGDAGVDSSTDAGELDTDYEIGSVDEYWGPAPDLETRLAIFDAIWDTFAERYANFVVNDVDWDAVRETHRPAIEEAQSFGRFFQVLQDMIITLHDGHTFLNSETVCAPFGSGGSVSTPDLSGRPPLFRLEDRASTIGACVTPLDDDRLLVYRVDPTNPAGLEPGDVLLGYDGVPWRELLDEIDAMELPVCGRTASNDTTLDHRRMTSIINNPHLFGKMDFQRHGSDAVESFYTVQLVDYSSELICTDQLPVAGVEPPCDTYDNCFNGEEGADNVSWGLLEGTNIGYIYIYSWRPGDPGLEFLQAVIELWDTDALIIDQRYGVGGWPNSFLSGVNRLFEEDPPQPLTYLVERDPLVDDYTAMDFDGATEFFHINANPDTYYDRPIAVLTGPHMGSAGDLFPYVMSHHPRARRFGRATAGRLAGIDRKIEDHDWYGEPDHYISDLRLAWVFTTVVDSELSYMEGMALTPEEEVWLTPEDVAAGVDTVVEAARSWIDGETAK